MSGFYDIEALAKEKIEKYRTENRVFLFLGFGQLSLWRKNMAKGLREISDWLEPGQTRAHCMKGQTNV